MNKCREVKDILGVSCNEEMIKEKSKRKEVRCEREKIEDWARKS